MKSATILSKSHNIKASLKGIYDDNEIPNFILELAEFGKCIYFIERNKNDKHLIFKTEDIERWERSKQTIEWILDILVEENSITLEFEEENIHHIDANNDHFSEDYYANILLSGGADSMCGLYHYGEQKGRNLVFTHIFHRSTPSLKTLKTCVEEDLEQQLFIIDGMFYEKAGFRHISGNLKDTDMNLNQTRTFFYLCNAVSVNYSLGIDKITITENGPLTINPPFLSSQKFTHTTNPEFIDLYNKFLSSYIGISDLIKVYLPFKNYTKSELMASLPTDHLQTTHSCSRKFNSKESCFNCYACFVRRFSAYAYGNFEDDYYRQIENKYSRYKYSDKNFIFNKEIDYFSKDNNGMLLVKFIEFCFDTINIENNKHYYQNYSGVMQKYREISKFYDDFWDLLKRFSSDIITGINNFFEKNRKYKNNNYYVWKIYNEKLNELYANNIIPKNFYQNVKKRIIERSKSIVGEL